MAELLVSAVGADAREADLDTGPDGQVAFYLTGQQSDEELAPIGDLGLRPALFAYRSDLTALRYDFPVLLLADRSDAAAVGSLTSIVDAALTRLADKSDTDRLRHHAHALERELRRLLAGRSGSFGLDALLAQAMQRLGESDGEMAAGIRALAAELPHDAELLDCERSMPGRMVAHLWAAAGRPRLAKMRAEIDRLRLKIADILDAAQARSDAGRTPEALQAAIGTVHAQMFDFVALSRVLGRGAPAQGLPQARTRRLHELLSVLESQRFFAEASPANAKPAYEFTFNNCTEALRAWHERLPKAIELVKAMTVAELEIAGEYDELRHDPLFEKFGEHGLEPAQAARFPSYLVQLDAEQLRPADATLALEALDAGVPLKIVIQSDDLLTPAQLGDGLSSLGLGNRLLTGAALNLVNAFVLQASAAQLFDCREKLHAALSAAGPALISVFSGAGGASEGIAPYLMAAAATESRAFPSFTYDPCAGPDWASRFSLDGNPQPDRDWPQHHLTWQDAEYQRVDERVAFTVVDMLACDRRFAAEFARAAPAAWNERMLPVADCVAQTQSASSADARVPYVMMVDGTSRLHRVVADERLIRTACRCLELWHGLQELGGIRNSHVARARAAWEEKAREPEPTDALPLAEDPAAAQAQAETPTAQPERSSDEPYIETARCSSCDECTKLNPKMFAYNKDKQAYIADPAAGTYRQLVEAAESCQVAIIHPGRPRNPNEPGLEELLARAAAFP